MGDEDDGHPELFCRLERRMYELRRRAGGGGPIDEQRVGCHSAKPRRLHHGADGAHGIGRHDHLSESGARQLHPHPLLGLPPPRRLQRQPALEEEAHHPKGPRAADGAKEGDHLEPRFHLVSTRFGRFGRFALLEGVAGCAGG
jgi:hypothetical protein